MNFGFVIDNRRCIGCHACSTACKSEHQVPLGVYRTWVKTVEVGQYPQVQRSFQVTRCNHCENAPCVRICPTQAMFQRTNGIVDFDSEECIGCKACIQACPYDAIHIDPATQSASKCNFCAHRVENNFEPSCVSVCPTHAILAGDLEDPNSEVAKALVTEPTTVRKPEQNTLPNLFYIDGNLNSLTPTLPTNRSSEFVWSDRIERQPEIESVASSSPSQTLVTYNAQHSVPWHWPVPAYLLTKSISTGVFLLLAYFSFRFSEPLGESVSLAGAVIANLMILATAGLLVFDLTHPTRFWKIFTRPNWRSWLTIGSFILLAYSVWISLWLVFEINPGSIFSTGPPSRDLFLMVGTPLAFATAVYTAFLLGQAEGRDIWQRASLFFHLIIQALLAGSATLVVMLFFLENGSPLFHWCVRVFLASLLANAVMLLVEFLVPHASEVASKASEAILRGPYRRVFWGGVVVAGHLLPISLFFFSNDLALLFAAMVGMMGLYLYDHCFILAPQRIPNS